jgi:hypothetical protein
MAMSNAAVRIAGTDEKEAAMLAKDAQSMSAARVVPAATPVPRYYFADAFEPLSSLIDSRGRRFSPRTAFVRGAAFRPAAGVVRSIIERTSSAQLDVEAAGPALLIASVTYDRDWRATVDGRAAPIAQINLSHQGVVVGPGRHRVAFRYSNPYLKIGFVVSILAALALAFAVIESGR